MTTRIKMAPGGTPKTLTEAIQNGMGGRAVDIEAHVIDFLSQRFSAALLIAEMAEEAPATFVGPTAVGSIQRLWRAITGREIAGKRQEPSVPA